MTLSNNIKNKKDSWNYIWKKKSNQIKAKNINDLLILNGWDTNLSKFSVKSWKNFVNYFIYKNKINKSHTILEIGCGAGAFLLPFYKKNIKCYGIDNIINFIKICKNFMPEAKFYNAEANNLKIIEKIKFDFIFCHSIFQYFPSKKYAYQVLKEVLRFKTKENKIYILDIPDNKKKKNYISQLKKQIGKRKYKEKYSKNMHQFYNYEYFAKIVKMNNYKIKKLTKNLLNKKTSRYRFNLIIY